MVTMRVTAASESEIAAFLSANKNWSVLNRKLHREYLFADFTSAFSFMSAVAKEAEILNHHPEWFNVYNKLIVDLTTHDAQAISVLDFKLAVTMDKLFSSESVGA